MARLVDQFILEQKHTDILISQMDGCGDVYRRKRKEVLLDARLLEVCKLYEDMPLSTYLEKIAEIVKQLKK